MVYINVHIIGFHWYQYYLLWTTTGIFINWHSIKFTLYKYNSWGFVKMIVSRFSKNSGPFTVLWKNSGRFTVPQTTVKGPWNDQNFFPRTVKAPEFSREPWNDNFYKISTNAKQITAEISPRCRNTLGDVWWPGFWIPRSSSGWECVPTTNWPGLGWTHWALRCNGASLEQ